MKIKKDGKVINLTESDLHRIVKKVLKEQMETGSDEGGKYAPKLVEIVNQYIDDNRHISAEWLFSKNLGDVTDERQDLLIGSTNVKSIGLDKWDRLMENYRKSKSLEDLTALMNNVKNGNVVIKPHNGGNITPAKFEVSGPKTLKIVNCPECAKV